MSEVQIGRHFDPRLEPNGRPLRVLVLGNSVAMMVKPIVHPRRGKTYVEWLRQRLPEEGIPAEVINRGRWYGVITDVARDFDENLRQHSPDIVIIHYGIVEASPRAMPMRLHSSLNEWMLSPAIGSLRWRRGLADRIWPALREWQRRFSASALGKNTSWVAAGRFEGELARLIHTIRRDTGARVVLMDICEPNDFLEYWLPGVRQRAARLQSFIEDAAKRGHDVSLVSARGLVARLGPDALPDGVHMSAEAHRRLAEMLVRQISDLTVSDPPSAASPQPP